MIEFMGLPGAGKTTGAALLMRGGARGGRRCATVTEAFWAASRKEADGVLKPLLLRLPRAIHAPLLGPMARLDLGHLFLSRERAFAELVFRELAGLADTRQGQSFLRALLLHAVQREAIERHLSPDLPVVAEEGFAQRAMTLFGYLAEGGEEGRAAAYAGAMPRPAGVIWIDTDPETCAARLARRPQPPYPLRSLPADRWPSQLAVGRKVLATTAAVLRESGVPVVVVGGGTDELFAQAAQILDRMR